MNISSTILEEVLSRLDEEAVEEYLDLALIRAAEGGNTAVVELLLSDTRVDPTARGNEALRACLANEDINSADLLVRDSRVTIEQLKIDLHLVDVIALLKPLLDDYYIGCSVAELLVSRGREEDLELPVLDYYYQLFLTAIMLKRPSLEECLELLPRTGEAMYLTAYETFERLSETSDIELILSELAESGLSLEELVLSARLLGAFIGYNAMVLQHPPSSEEMKKIESDAEDEEAIVELLSV